MIQKRIFDVVVSALGLVVLAPLMAGISILIRITLGPPIFFRQTRPGLKGQPFTIFKFRTMRHAQSGELAIEKDAQRMTPVGTFLRKCSLDELPELWNVLRGEMSLVGPRPLLMDYLERYTPQQARRMEVRPGITGWAQVHGRNALLWEEKFKLDLWYVDNRSFWLDLKILCMTVVQVVVRRGISAEGCATMPEFLGEQGAQDRNEKVRSFREC
jgi:lipopolysaccharide/colanic/teichoic acid biosynthesis glycosyltransferase